MIQDFFRHQGIVKSTVSGAFEDLKFKISEGYKHYFIDKPALRSTYLTFQTPGYFDYSTIKNLCFKPNIGGYMVE